MGAAIHLSQNLGVADRVSSWKRTSGAGFEPVNQKTAVEKTLVDIRAKIENHIKNTYLKRVGSPAGVKPALRCWMELNE